MSAVTKQYNPVFPVQSVPSGGGTTPPPVLTGDALTAAQKDNVNFANLSAAQIATLAGALAQYSGVQIPKIWSKQMNVKFYASTLLSKVANTNWQGEIKKGTDTVYIRTAPKIAIEEYKIGQRMEAQMPVATMQELVINKAFYFLLKLHDIHDVQADQDMMAQWAADAAKQMAIKVEERCFFDWYTKTSGNTRILNTGGDVDEGTSPSHIPAANHGATAGVKSGGLNVGTDVAPIQAASSVSSDTALGDPLVTAVINAGTILDEQNIPDSGRFLLCSPLDINHIMRSRMWQAEKVGDPTTMIRNKSVGRIANFDVYVSNLLPYAAAGRGWVTGLGTRGSSDAGGAVSNSKKRHLMIAGTKDACTYASQITDTESFRDTEDFGEKMRGLNVFGCELINGRCMVPIVVADDQAV